MFAKKNNPKIHFELSRGTIWLMILLGAGVVIWIFILGILVGRGALFSGPAVSRLQQQIDRVKKEKVEKESAPLPSLESNWAFLDNMRQKSEPPPPPLPSPGSKPKEAPPPGAKEKTELGLWTIQVGSFRSEDEAKKAVQSIKDAGFPAYLVRADLPRLGIWYRVRVGKFAEQDQAEGIALKIKASLKKEAFVLRMAPAKETSDANSEG